MADQKYIRRLTGLLAQLECVGIFAGIGVQGELENTDRARVSVNLVAMFFFPIIAAVAQ